MIMTAESEYTDSVELILLAMGGGGGDTIVTINLSLACSDSHC